MSQRKCSAFGNFFLLLSHHMEVSGPGIESSHSCDLCHSCSDAGSLTHCARLGIELTLPQQPKLLQSDPPPLFFFLRAAPAAYESSWAKGRIIAAAIATPDLSLVCKLCHSLWQHWILNLLSEARNGTCILTEAMSGL